jgi:hypothetical protein
MQCFFSSSEFKIELDADNKNYDTVSVFDEIMIFYRATDESRRKSLAVS